MLNYMLSIQSLYKVYGQVKDSNNCIATNVHVQPCKSSSSI